MADVMEEEEEAEEGAAWMATFADMMSLLLTFFILLLSFASMDITQFRMALGSVKDALGVRYEHPGNVEAVATNIVEFSERESASTLSILDIDMATLRKSVEEAVERRGLSDKVEVSTDARGVIVRITGQVLYGVGSAKLRTEASEVLDGVVEICQMLPYEIIVEGHTDDRPIKTSQFPSNWELSTARAATAMRYLVEKGSIASQRMGIAGYAHMKPLESNKTTAGRARNRRVEFVFIRKVTSEADAVEAEAEAAAAAELEVFQPPNLAAEAAAQARAAEPPGAEQAVAEDAAARSTTGPAAAPTGTGAEARPQ